MVSNDCTVMKTFLFLLVSVASCFAQLKPNAYTTNNQANADAYAAALIASQIGGSNFLSLSDPAGTFELMPLPPKFQTNISSTVYSSWPVIDRDLNGDYVLVFGSAIKHMPTNGAVMMSKSTNLMVSWSTPVIILTNSTYDQRAYFAFGISKSTGRYILMSSGISLSGGQQRPTLTQYSDDQGSSWSTNGTETPPQITPYSISNAVTLKIITAANGRLVASYHSISNNNASSIAYALTSDTEGLTWQTNFLGISSISGFNETAFVYCGNSNILGLIRRNENTLSLTNILFQVRSSDNGFTWVQDGAVSLGIATPLRNPAGLYLYEGESGRRIVLGYGNRTNNMVEIREISLRRIWGSPSSWLSATLQQFPLDPLCTLPGDGGYVSLAGGGISGDCVGAYYFSSTNNFSVPAQAEIRFFMRSVP